MPSFCIGVDEAGRGPLAGPVTVAAVSAPADFSVRRKFPGVTDSKKLSPLEREELFKRLEFFQGEGILRYCVVFASSKEIDRVGIVKAVRRCVYKSVRLLAPEPSNVEVLLDGLLHAPSAYKQKTIVEGDILEPLISLASIAAKVQRDHFMERLAKRFPQYGFESHKGYGTRSHRNAIASFGLSEIHRKSYCKDNFTFPAPMIG